MKKDAAVNDGRQIEIVNLFCLHHGHIVDITVLHC